MNKHRSLIKASLKGDSSAFEQIYRMHSPRLMGVCLRYSFDAEEAQDLLQDAFIKIFEKLDSFRTEGSFEGWMHRITVHVALDNYRKKQRTKTDNFLEVADFANDIIDEENILSQVAHQDLLHLVQGLPPKYRMVFNLYVIEGYKHGEIAEMLKINEGTSKSNLSDARRILQKKVIELSQERTMDDVKKRN